MEKSLRNHWSLKNYEYLCKLQGEKGKNNFEALKKGFRDHRPLKIDTF